MEWKEKIVIYRTADGQTSVNVRMDGDTVWLSQAQMAELFQKDRTVIGRHINNIYKEHELERETTCANFAHMGKDADQTYQTALYNLDVIISVGYRVSVPHLGQQSAERLSGKRLCRQQSPDRAAVFRIKAISGSFGPDGTKRIADNGKYCSGLVLQYFDKQILTNAARAFRTFLILLKAHALIIT